MDLCLYSGVDGVLVLVPEPCLPPLDAQQTFGPLAFHGRVRVDTESATWTGILDQIERHLFATISATAGATLPGVVLGGIAPATS